MAWDSFKTIKNYPGEPRAFLPWEIFRAHLFADQGGDFFRRSGEATFPDIGDIDFLFAGRAGRTMPRLETAFCVSFPLNVGDDRQACGIP